MSSSPGHSHCPAIEHLPGPKGLPILGNLLELKLDRLHRILEQWCKLYGPVYKFRIGHKTVVVVADPDLVNEVLRSRPKAYRRLSSIEAVARELGVNGVFSAEGEEWRKQRRLVMHALAPERLRAFFPILRNVTQRLKTRWDRAASRRHAIEIREDFRRYTADVTTNLAFGYDMNTLERENDAIQRHLEKIFPALNARVNAPFPYWHYFRLPRDRALEKALERVHREIRRFIAHGRERLAQNPGLAAHPGNLLDAMLAARDETGSGFTDDVIFANVFTLLLAGEDTTANTMAWIVYFMTEYPDVLGKIQEEVDQTLGKAQIIETFEDTERLRFVEAVAYESMRLKPVAPVFFMESNEEVDLGAVRIPRGTALMLVTRYGVLQETNFTASQAFQPQRWLESGSTAGSAHNTKAFVPFGGGPRFCPGRYLALVEIKTVLAMLCRNFEISRPGRSVPVTERFAFTMMPQNLRVCLSTRQAGA